MKYVNLKIQPPFLHRRGFRCRWLTVYFHQYQGNEVSERCHFHPFKWSISLLLSGSMRGDLIVVDSRGNALGTKRRERKGLSARLYKQMDKHRVKQANGSSLFIGVLRTQLPLPPFATEKTHEGYCHYSEVRDVDADESRDDGGDP